MNYSSYSDEELISNFKLSDSGIYEYLLDKYKYLVRAKERAYFLNGGSEEDMIQEGMIGLFKAIRDYSNDKNCSFKSFAELCIKRQMITAVKSSTRQKHMPMINYISLDRPAFDNEDDKPVMEALHIEEQASDPQAILIKSEDKANLMQKMDEVLSKFEKTVLEMYLNGQSYDEISSHLGKTNKSVDNALQRVKKKLIGSLEDKKTD